VLAALIMKPAKVAIAALLSLTLLMVVLVMLINHLRPVRVESDRRRTRA
jgi:hypothetical protein